MLLAFMESPAQESNGGCLGHCEFSLAMKERDMCWFIVLADCGLTVIKYVSMDYYTLFEGIWVVLSNSRI